MSFKGGMKGVRYQQGDSWFSRSQNGIADLADLKSHRGFAFLMDVYDGNLRSLWNQWLDPELDAQKADKIRQKAIWLRDLVNELDEVSGEKDLHDAQDKCYQGFTADASIASAHAEHVEAGNY